MTWKLWRALNKPPRWHAFYRRMVQAPEPRLLELLRRYASLLVVLCFALLCSGMWLFPHVKLLPVLFMLLLVSPIFFIVFTGIIFGTFWAVSISNAITRERESETFDLLCVLPPGPLGVTWTLGKVCLHHRRIFQTIHTQRNWVMREVIAPIMLVLVIGFSIPSPNNQPYSFFVALFLLSVHNGALVAASYLEYMQSVVLGALLGMLVPTFVQRRFDAQVGALLGFLTLQIMVYLFTLVAGFLILPALFQRVHLSGFSADLSLPVMRLAIFYAIREGIIRLLWHTLAQRLHTDPTAPELMVQTAV